MPWGGAGTGFPVGAAGFPQVGNLVFLVPSGDVSGNTDASNVMAAFNGKLIPVMTPGQYYWLAGVIVIPAPGFYIWGMGDGCTIVNGVGTGTLLRMYNTVFFTPHSHDQKGGGIKGGLTFDLSAMGAGSQAIHAGDIIELEWYCTVRYGPGPIGVWFDNQYAICEQMSGRITCVNNVGSNVTFDNSANLSGFATGSYDRLSMEIYLDQNGLGNGVVFQNGANLIDGRLGIYGNFTGGGSLWYVLTVTGSNLLGFSLIQDCALNIGVELDTLSGTVPGTINFGTVVSNNILDCTGIIDFGAADAFAGANNPQGSFKFDGPVYGDGFLQGSQSLYGAAFKFTGSGVGGVLANANLITTRFASIIEVTTSGNVTGIILQGFPPEEWRNIWLMNNGTGTITMDVSGTSHVANGVTCVIQPNTQRAFVWNQDQSLWYSA